MSDFNLEPPETGGSSAPLNDALEAFEVAAEALIARVEQTDERREAIADLISEPLSSDCRGAVCPVLAPLARAHNVFRYKAAIETDLKTSFEAQLAQVQRVGSNTEALFGIVMDRVSEDAMSAETGEALLEGAGVHDDDNEIILAEKIDVQNDRIEQLTAKMRTVGELYAQVGVKTEEAKGFEGVAVSIRKVLGRTAADEVCNGPKFHLREANVSRAFSCTSPQALAILHAAIDKGLVVLDDYEAYLDQRQRSAE